MKQLQVSKLFAKFGPDRARNNKFITILVIFKICEGGSRLQARSKAAHLWRNRVVNSYSYSMKIGRSDSVALMFIEKKGRFFPFWEMLLSLNEKNL